MEIKEFTGLVVSIYTDEIFKFSYIRFLTMDRVEVLKINARVGEFKLQYVLNPQYILTVEAIKTRKNWIIKDIINFRRITQPNNYADILRLSEIMHILSDQCVEGQEISILPWMINTLSSNLQDISTQSFSRELDKRLNFRVAEKNLTI